MADISTGMKVTGLSQYKSAMQQAQQSVRTLDAQLKKTEAQYKATGDKEQYMSDKADTLKKKLAEQQKAADQAQKALQQMAKNGVDPSSASFQKMEQQLLNAQTGVLQTTADLNELTAGTQAAAKGADQLTTSVNGISKKISLDQVISGVNSITSALEGAAQKAVQVGKAIWDEMLDSAKWADDSATMAMMYGIDLEKFLQVQKLVQNGMDTSVEAILKSRSKLLKNAGEGSDTFLDTLRELNLLQKIGGKYGDIEIIPESSVDLFWEAGKAIMALGDEYEQEAKAQALFGRGWRELIPLFNQYHSEEEFNKALEGVNTNTEEEVSALADLNDKLGELQGNFDTLETKVLAGFAPALTKGAEALSGLLDKLLEYLETPEGQQALDDMRTAVEGLFADLASIDPDKVVESFSTMFSKVVESFEWLANNWQTVKSAVEKIAIAFGLLKVSETVLTFMKLGQGLGGIFNKKAIADAATAAAAGAGSGAAAGAQTVTATQAGLFFQKLGEGIANTAQQFSARGLGFPMLQDWFMNNTLPGQTLRDTGDVGEMVKASGDAIMEYFTKELPENFDNFINRDSYWGKIFEGVESYFDTLGKSWSGFMADWEEKHSASNSSILGKGDLMEDWDRWFGNKPPAPVPVKPEVPENAAEEISKEVGTVQIGARIVPISFTGGAGGGGGGKFSVLQFHANGLPFVPFDGYPAVLHKGERVVPAREVERTQNYSSNLYVESMYMNNGQDAEGLAAAIAAANRRTMRGFGS